MAEYSADKGIQQLNVVWVIFSFFEIYLVAVNRIDAFNGLSLMVITFLVIWYVGQKAKLTEIENMVVGDKARGQWDKNKDG